MKRIALLLFFLFGLKGSSVAVDRYGHKTLWDLQLRGFFLARWDSVLAKSGLDLGLNALFLGESCAPGDVPQGLEVYQLIPVDDLASPAGRVAIDLTPLAREEADKTTRLTNALQRRLGLLRRVASSVRTGSLLVKLPDVSSRDQLFSAAGVEFDDLPEHSLLIGSGRNRLVPRERLVVWIEGVDSLEEEIQTESLKGAAGFIIANYVELSEEQRLRLRRFGWRRYEVRLNQCGYLDVPLAYQETEYYCGSAVVEMVVGYLKGEHLKQRWLARQLGTKGPTAGTAPRRIAEFLAAQTRGLYREVEEFSHEIVEKNIRCGFPVVARMSTKYLQGWEGVFGHYVVIKGFNTKYYYVNDPVKGAVFYSRHELETAVRKHYFGPLLIVGVR